MLILNDFHPTFKPCTVGYHRNIPCEIKSLPAFLFEKQISKKMFVIAFEYFFLPGSESVLKVNLDPDPYWGKNLDPDP